jgi:AraC family transcriptional activator of pobA
MHPSSPAPVPRIESYDLYGEVGVGDDPEFVHIEDIRSRSRLYQWRITPHSHRRMFQVVTVDQGGAEVWLDGVTQRMDGPAVICIPGGVVHGFTFETDTEGWVLTLSELQLMDARYRRSRKLLEPLFQEPLILSLEGAPADAILLNRTMEQMNVEFHWPRLGRESMFEWLMRMVLMTIRRRVEDRMVRAADRGDRRARFLRFRQLVEDHYREHWPVAAYAEDLAVSQAVLNRLCQSFAGKGAGEVIQDRVMLEAERLLIYTSASAAQIAYELGYQDPAYFSRAFKRRKGMAPGRFRVDRMERPFPG